MSRINLLITGGCGFIGSNFINLIFSKNKYNIINLLYLFFNPIPYILKININIVTKLERKIDKLNLKYYFSLHPTFQDPIKYRSYINIR